MRIPDTCRMPSGNCTSLLYSIGSAPIYSSESAVPNPTASTAAPVSTTRLVFLRQSAKSRQPAVLWRRIHTVSSILSGSSGLVMHRSSDTGSTASIKEEKFQRLP